MYNISIMEVSKHLFKNKIDAIVYKKNNLAVLFYYNITK